MTRFTKYQLITMGALVGMLLFNPLVVEVFEEYFKLVYTGISLVCTVWVVVFLLYKVMKPEKVNYTPKKKSKSQPKFIET